MPIYGIVGNTGGGKSYRSVQIILEAIEKKRPVVTNIPLLFENPLIYPWDWSYLEPDKPKSLLINVKQEPEPAPKLEYPKGAVYVLDEVWRAFLKGTRIDQVGEKTLMFFKEHRHNKSAEGIVDDIFLVTQNLSDIPDCIRSLCKQTILCEKPDDIGLDDIIDTVL